MRFSINLLFSFILDCYFLSFDFVICFQFRLLHCSTQLSESGQKVRKMIKKTHGFPGSDGVAWDMWISYMWVVVRPMTAVPGREAVPSLTVRQLARACVRIALWSIWEVYESASTVRLFIQAPRCALLLRKLLQIRLTITLHRSDQIRWVHSWVVDRGVSCTQRSPLWLVLISV